MNTSGWMRPIVLAGAVLATAGAAYAQTAVGTGFTYQGRLEEGGLPANGDYDFQARLFDDAVAGTQIGITLMANDLPVVDGLFGTFMDFGAAAFTTEARWLELSVRPGASTGAYTTLTPRQRIRPAPLAIRSLNDANWSVTGDHIFNTNTGFVGIHESSPLSYLHVQGAGSLLNFDVGDLGTDQIVVEGGQAWLGLYSDEVGAPASGISLAEIDSTTGAMTKWSLVQRTSGDGGDFSITYGSDPAGNANARYFQVKPTGDVGIGVNNPSARLHVKVLGTEDNVVPPSFRAVSEYPLQAGGTSTEYIQFEGNRIFAIKDGADAMLKLQESGGPVRIGSLNVSVDDPKLIVSRNTSLMTNNDLQFEDLLIHDTGNAWLGLYSDHLGNVGSGITFAEKGLTQYKWGMYARTTDNVGDLVITFGTDVNPTANEKMLQIDRDGTTKVKVLEILGADVAERFPTSGKVEPGHVVMIDAASPGQLCMSQGAYNSKVAGVVSGAGDLPVGAVLGNLPGTDRESSPPVALSGRVWTWCDASEHAIEPGDLLTTSQTPGHAMKAVDAERRGGAVIGKAMSALKQGEKGLVLVLINLQ